MALYNVTYGKNNARLILPDKLEASEYIQALKRELDPRQLNRVIQTVDETIEAIIELCEGRLVWASTGIAFGRRSIQPTNRINHLWDSVTKAIGDGRGCNIAVGSLLRWRISLRSETWLLWVEETNERDKITDELITRSHYWIDEEFVPHATPSIFDLANKLGAKIYDKRAT